MCFVYVASDLSMSLMVKTVALVLVPFSSQLALLWEYFWALFFSVVPLGLLQL